MTAGPFLTPEGEDAWLRMKQHLELCDGFALVFLFTAHAQVIELLRERLAKIYHARVTGLKTPAFSSPTDLCARLLPLLLHPPLHKQSIQAPYWINLSNRQGNDWDQGTVGLSDSPERTTGISSQCSPAAVDPGSPALGTNANQGTVSRSLGHTRFQPVDGSVAHSVNSRCARPAPCICSAVPIYGARKRLGSRMGTIEQKEEKGSKFSARCRSRSRCMPSYRSFFSGAFNC